MIVEVLPFFKNVEQRPMRALTLSNALSAMRLILAPFIVIAIVTQNWTGALWLFVCAAVSDFL